MPGLPNDTYKSQGEHHEQLINLTIPWETGADGIPARSKCTRFHFNATDGDVRHVVECDAWVYDKTLFDETVTSEVLVFMYLCIYLFIYLFVRSCVRACVRSFIYSFVYLFIYLIGLYLKYQ